MRIFLLIALSILLCSCDEDRPKNVLAQGKMVDVKWDLMQAEEMTKLLKASDSTYPDTAKLLALSDQILTMHGVSKQDFNKSLDYYTAHPQLLKEILDSIQAKGLRLQSASSGFVPVDTNRIVNDTTAIPKDSAAYQRLRDSLRRKKFFKTRP